MKKYVLSAFIFMFAGMLYAEECSRPVIFPLISKPLNDTGMEYANYNWKTSCSCLPITIKFIDL